MIFDKNNRDGATICQQGWGIIGEFLLGLVLSDG